jgi:hypothetical protein
MTKRTAACYVAVFLMIATVPPAWPQSSAEPLPILAMQLHATDHRSVRGLCVPRVTRVPTRDAGTRWENASRAWGSSRRSPARLEPSTRPGGDIAIAPAEDGGDRCVTTLR